VTKTVKATWNGNYYEAAVPVTKTTYAIGCPQGWAATGAAWGAFVPSVGNSKKSWSARLLHQVPIVSQDGTVIGFRMRVALNQEKISIAWWVEFSVVCAKLGA
jgi:hypothetical protein